MNASGSKPDVMWSPPIDTTPTTVTAAAAAATTTTTSPLSEGESEGLPKSIFSIPPSTDLLSGTSFASSSMFLSNFTRLPFPIPSLAELCSLSINPMARLLLAQFGAAALSSLNQNPPLSIPSGGSEQKSSKNLFSIADYIGEDDVKDGENREDGRRPVLRDEEREAAAAKSEINRGNNGTLCCPICHEDLTSENLSLHISLELQALDEETQRLQNCRYEQNIYERCMNFSTSGLFDHISSSQRYCKFQLVKERRLARKHNPPYNKVHEDYDRSNQQSLKIPSPLESGFPFFPPQTLPSLPTKIRRRSSKDLIDTSSLEAHPVGPLVNPSVLFSSSKSAGHKTARSVRGAFLASRRIQGSLVDYHDYKLMEQERLRKGPGEQGVPVYLEGEEKERSKKIFTENGFCQIVSDKIALDRAIPDLRHKQCSAKRYSSNLPSVSVIIPVFQEHWTTLLRSVVTVTKRSPPGIIKEIILVDDGSEKQFLKEQLDEYAKNSWPSGYLKVLHHKERTGLITARLTGAKIATGEVLIFLDSHVEAGTNWLPPLLDPIVRDYRTVVCPFIDVIDHDTFEYRAQDDGRRGAFDWNLNYKRLPRLADDAYHPAENFDSPVMAGGLFAISTKWFWELGGYDPGLEIWGCEQYELSFKIWMCGGRMVDSPCSRIGHIYRGAASFPSAGKGDFLSRNYRRLMDVWMDNYTNYIYQRRPHLRSVDPGDLTEQRAIRDKLHCKSFEWFMKNIAFDLVKHYPPVVPIPGAYGKIHVASDMSYCIFSSATQMLLAKCSDTTSEFELTWHADVAIKGTGDCWDVPVQSRGSPIQRYACHGQKGNQHFTLRWLQGMDSNPLMIQHVPSGSCVEADVASLRVYLAHCDNTIEAQHWHWDTVQWKKAKKHELELNLEA
ncbi:hypothetical protein Aperf_G00000084984 [Anoplocephala perfoliata]